MIATLLLPGGTTHLVNALQDLVSGVGEPSPGGDKVERHDGGNGGHSCALGNCLMVSKGVVSSIAGDLSDLTINAVQQTGQ